MPNLDDDWMNPPTHSFSYDPVEAEKRRLARPYLIQRQRVIQCSWMGTGGPPTQWDEWASFETKAERDKELARLRKETSWHLRARQLDGFGHVMNPDHLDYP